MFNVGQQVNGNLLCGSRTEQADMQSAVTSGAPKFQLWGQSEKLPVPKPAGARFLRCFSS